MDESILTSIKKLLGISEEDESFDIDIIMHINSVFGALKQLGVGAKGFTISDKSTTWADYLGEAEHCFEMVKMYIFMNVRMVFDTPSGSAVDAYKEKIKEYEWRIHTELDYSVEE
jgi:hypothetical protein